jgi:lysophospholipase L1-like esterase
MFRPLTITALLLVVAFVVLVAGCSTGPNRAVGGSASRSSEEASDEPAGRVGSFSVLAIGDSLMVGARDQLADAHPGIVLDAERGRKFSTGIDVLEDHLATSTPDVVVFALGTNNGATPEQIAEVMNLASNVEEVIFVNVVVPRAWQEGTNVAILEAAALYDNVSFVDWHAASFGTSELFRSDGYHLNPSGIERWVTLIIDATRA